MNLVHVLIYSSSKVNNVRDDYKVNVLNKEAMISFLKELKITCLHNRFRFVLDY